MATLSKRAWKLQEFVAHNANVNCLALGHKSGRVMVTGGDDKKVNLWAVGKQSCFMSLSGHTTPIECVQFNHVEELVCAGSQAGALKVWDLEAAKLVRTLTGHRNSIKSIDFHPYSDFLASGSLDCSIKLWDSRKKGYIFSYPGHKSGVNSLKFSPDGQWIASGGEDSLLKIWDIRIGRVIKEFTYHENSVSCIEFHPREFLLASGGLDRSVNFYDLESFQLVSSERDLGVPRCIWFSPDGECLFAGVRDYMKVIGWEPNRLFDSVPVNWGRISDISTAQNQVVGASFHLTNVMVYVVDLAKVQPLSAEVPCPSPFSANQSIRKSFSQAERPVSLRNKLTLDVKTVEESTSGTDPEEESSADITNLKDYNDIFKGRGCKSLLRKTDCSFSVTRTPPPEPEPFREPISPINERHFDPTEPQILGHPSESLEALSLDNSINYRKSPLPVLNPSTYSRSKSNLDQVYRASNKQDRENVLTLKPQAKAALNPTSQIAPKFNLQRQSSCKDVPDKMPKPSNNIKHSVSEANISKTSNTNNLHQVNSRAQSRKNSFSKPSRNSSVPNVSKIPNFGSGRNTDRSERSGPVKPTPIITTTPVDIYVNPKISPDEKYSNEKYQEEFVPLAVDRPVGLDLDEFLPKSQQSFRLQQQHSDMSEAEVMGILMRGHMPMTSMLNLRQRNLKLVFAQYRNKDMKSAVETAITMDDASVIVDLLGILNCKHTLWNLDLCTLMLPKLEEILQSKYETYMTTACNAIKLILRYFAPVIKTNIQSPVGSFGVDISREERYRKSIKCHEYLQSIRSVLVKKQTIPGTLGSQFKEINVLMKNALD